MSALLREPLVHFLVLGAALFAAFQWTPRSGATEPQRVIVAHGTVQQLAGGFARTWSRPPAPGELEALLRDHVREEVAVREALALGLDRDDTVIRRRLRQKLEFVSGELAAPAEPTDAELAAHLAQHPGRFRRPARLTFRHVFLDPRRGGALARDAAGLLAELGQRGVAADASALGDPLMLGPAFDAVPVDEIAALFGEPFAAALAALEPGRWHGPVASGYGAHLVLVEGRTPGAVPELAEIQEEVRREWAAARRLEASERFYEALLQRYAVTIEAARP